MSTTDDLLIEALAARLEPVVSAAVERATRAALEEREPKPASPLLTVSQVAKRLACSEESVRRYQKAGRLRGVTSLAHLRFRVEDVEAFLAGTVES